MELFPINAEFDSFFVFNLVSSFACLAALIWFYFSARYAFVKPSLMITACYHVLAQWPLVLLSAFAQQFLPSPWMFALLTHGFVIGGLLVARYNFNSTAHEIWSSIPDAITPAPQWPLWTVLACIAALAAIYLSYVPFTHTGLYMLLTDPSRVSEAREYSLKLLNNDIPRYALTLLANVGAPLLTIMVMWFVILNRSASMTSRAMWVFLLIPTWILSVLSGAKGFLVFLVVAAVATAAWAVRLRVHMAWIITAFVAAMLPAFLTSVVLSTRDQRYSKIEQTDSRPPPPSSNAARTAPIAPVAPIAQVAQPNFCERRFEGAPKTSAIEEERRESEQKELAASRQEQGTIAGTGKQPVAIEKGGRPAKVERGKQAVTIEEEKQAQLVQRDITTRDVVAQGLETAKRTFVVPGVVAIWFADYVQRRGPIGIAGIPRLAAAVGITPIDMPNVIGLLYTPCYYGHEVMSTVNATTGYLYAQYSNFGILALPLSLLGLIVIDLLLLLVRRLSPIWIVPIQAFLSLDALKFTQSDYFTIWITHGLILVVAAILIFDQVQRISLGRIRKAV